MSLRPRTGVELPVGVWNSQRTAVEAGFYSKYYDESYSLVRFENSPSHYSDEEDREDLFEKIEKDIYGSLE